MIIYNQIDIFKTPLTPDYKNVIDSHNDKDQYRNFLMNYEHITVTLDENRSLKENNGVVTVTVNFADEGVPYVEDYNYLCVRVFRNRSSSILPFPYYTYRFYFIEEIVDQFQSLNILTVTFRCKIDAFAENYELLQNSTKYDVNYMKRCHYDNVEYNSASGIVVNKPLNTKEPLVEMYPTTSSQTNRVLWARILTSKEVAYVSLDPISQGLKINDFDDVETSTPSTAFTRVFYMPIAVYKVGGFNKPTLNTLYKKATTKTSKETAEREGWTIPILWNMLDNFGNVVGISTYTASVLSIELTYFSPYSYEFEGDLLIIKDAKAAVLKMEYANEYDGNFSCAKCVATDSAITNSPLITKKDQKNSLSINATDVSEFLLFYNTGVTSNIYDTFITIDPNSFPYETRLAYAHIVDKVTALLYEPRSHFYPYFYTRFMIGGEQFDYIPTDRYYDGKITVLFDYLNKTNVGYKICTTQDRYSSDYTYYHTKSQVIQSVDSGNEYLRNNSNSILSGTLSSIGKSVISKGFTTPKLGKLSVKGKRALVNDAFDLASSVAEYKDYDNKADAHNLPDFNAFNDPYQDLLLYSYMDIKTDYDKIKVFDLLHYYGVALEQKLSLRLNQRELFDYKETEECSLPFITNMSQRLELEEAYNNGITRWHLPIFLSNNPDTPNEDKENMLWFDGNYINMNLQLREYYNEHGGPA